MTAIIPLAMASFDSTGDLPGLDPARQKKLEAIMSANSRSGHSSNLAEPKEVNNCENYFLSKG